MPLDNEDLPTLSDAVIPPTVHGTAELFRQAYTGTSLDTLLGWIGPSTHTASSLVATPETAWLLDAAIVHQLGFRRSEGLGLQAEALARNSLFRVAGLTLSHAPLRVLGVCAPGDLMVNTPLDFITNALDVRLDLLFVRPDQPLPNAISDHDVAVFCISEADPTLRHRLQHLFDMWPRPALNNPVFLPGLARDMLARSLTSVDRICSPTAVAVGRGSLDQYLRERHPIDGFESQVALYPCLIRPIHSHAGTGLSHLACDADLYAYLRLSLEEEFFLTAFEDYADTDGLYRKLRVAFIDREPFLCHMAISRHWMVHYLNAGMAESAEKRTMEAEAMATFRTGFACRHAAAFSALHERLGFDYYSIDCSETRDGRLLLFEADTAAIIHAMDPPDLFPYKAPQMHRVFQAFGEMLNRHAVKPRRLMAQAEHRKGLHVPA